MALTAAATDATPPSLSAANALLPILATISQAAMMMMMMTMMMKLVMTMVMTSAAGTERQALPIPSTPAA